MRQMTLAAAKGFEVHGRATRKAEFLARMEALVPWDAPTGSGPSGALRGRRVRVLDFQFFRELLGRTAKQFELAGKIHAPGTHHQVQRENPSLKGAQRHFHRARGQTRGFLAGKHRLKHGLHQTRSWSCTTASSTSLDKE